MEDSELQLINEKQQQAEQNQASIMKYQKFLYDSFVELRVKFQKLMLPLNRMPQGEAYDAFCESNGDIKKSSEEVIRCIFRRPLKIVELAIKGFIGDMVDLNTTIMSKNSDITAHTKHFTPKQNVITEDSTDEEIWKEIATSLSIKRKWQDDTVTYWSKRSQALNGTLSAKSLSALNKDIPSQINSILEDESRWRKRYSVIRGNYSILGMNEIAPEEDGLTRNPNIYDDADFYNSLLSYYTNKQEGTKDPYSLRKTKINKKEVNRKASKGRRLRFQVHPKLLNFCAPEPYAPPPMNVGQLFSSLFGKSAPENPQEDSKDTAAEEM